ncbi:NACHT domain-containing protein [Pseudomonas sp. HR1]|uniref:NACHT domain-containing protein n=1 Tax=Pseudomonas sp. HR1 TaxID=1463361 RepID=UPI002542BC18|nr:NACHT domain-containing protein [Pseudomonas sp. HR1]MDK4200818.1 NACHT domain-containing protein [Pseudomonas sp. HR1]
MEPIAAGVSLVNATGTPKKIAESKIVSDVFDSLVLKYKLSSFSDFKENYLKSCSGNLLVKTIASPDSYVHVDEIYVPLDLSGHSRIEVESGTTLDNSSRASLIVGLAGQGKSTILRKLLSNNISKISRLPFFYELKHYAGGEIEIAISKNLSAQGVEFSPGGLKKILNDSNVRLFLDAFDECPSDHKAALFHEIDKLVRKYNCNIICTTRPDTELDALVGVDIYRVEFLKPRQIRAIIHKTCSDLSKAEELCGALERSHFHKESDSILRSPILVVLFCVSYNLGISIPESLSQFYKNIFDTVFLKHDNLKGKVSRVRHWNDDRSIYRNVFDYFCFISQRKSLASFSFSELAGLMAESLSYFSRESAVADVIASELIGITNLIIKDGYDEYKFIHKSIQEFYCASFLATGLATDKKKEFYRKCAEEIGFYNIFSNTLLFMREIDSFDYLAFFVASAVSKMLGLEMHSIDDNYIVDRQLIERYMTSVKYVLRYEESFDRRGGATVVAEIFSAKISSAVKNTFSYKLFSTASDFMQMKHPSDSVIKAIASQSKSLGEGLYETDLKGILPFIEVAEVDIENSLMLSLGILYRREYNSAIDHISNRVTQVSKQGYLDFDLE